MWAALGGVVLLVLAAMPSAAFAQQEVEEPAIRTAIESVLLMDTGRQTRRLPRVTIDPAGDLTVVFAMRREGRDEPALILPAALEDARTILQAVYASEAAPRVRTMTVLGTYAVFGKYSLRETPLLRAVVSADTAAGLDWQNIAPFDLPAVVDSWWLQSDLAAASS